MAKRPLRGKTDELAHRLDVMTSPTGGRMMAGVYSPPSPGPSRQARQTEARKVARAAETLAASGAKRVEASARQTILGQILDAIMGGEAAARSRYVRRP